MVLFKSSIIDFKFLQNRLLESSSGLGDAQNDNAMLVTIVAMFGNHKIDNFNLQALKMLLGHFTSMGIIGGVQNQAYYIIGEFEGNFMILDPHKVNKSENIDSSLPNPDISSYNPHRDAHFVHYTKFDPCLHLTFLVKSQADLESLEFLFHEIDTLFGKDLYICPRFSNPEYSQSQRTFSRQASIGDLHDFSEAENSPPTSLREIATDFCKIGGDLSRPESTHESPVIPLENCEFIDSFCLYTDDQQQGEEEAQGNSLSHSLSEPVLNT